MTAPREPARAARRRTTGFALALPVILAACGGSGDAPTAEPSPASSAADGAPRDETAAGAARDPGDAGGGASRARGAAPVADDALVEVLPLASRSAPADGGPRFRKLPPGESGLDFVHAWRPERVYLGILGNAMSGGGVAAGDLDGDGLPELVLTRPYGGTRLYRNGSGAPGTDGDAPGADAARPGLRFTDISREAGLVADAWGGGATFGDLDDDGDLDLYVCGYDTPNRLYWNDGGLPLREGASAAGLAFRGSSIMFALADWDLDGDLDGYLLTNRVGTESAPEFPPPDATGRVTMPEELLEEWDVLYRPDGRVVYIPAGQYDHLYRNEGDGTFTDVSARAGITGNHYGLSATWWDPDDDGWPDLYVANDFYGPDKLYANGRDGTFTDVAPALLPHTPWFSMGSDAGDVDGDGLQDLIASDMLATTHERRHVTFTDLSEGRWFLDAAVPRQYMRNALFLNTGVWAAARAAVPGAFQEAAFTAGVARSDWTWSTVFGDLDLDGRLDLFVSNGMSRDYFNYDLRAAAGEAGDVMGDFWTHQDVLEEANLAFRNVGDVAFESVGADWGLDHVGASFGGLLCDLDRDGDLDVVTNDFESPAGLYENRSAAGHALEVELRGVSANRDGVGARVTVTSRGADGATRTQVRHLFPTHGYMAGHEPRLHFGLGGDVAVESVEVRWPGGRVQTVRDVEPDTALRITEDPGARPAAEPPRPPPWFATFLGPAVPEPPHDDFAVQRLLPARLSRAGPPLACGDLDGDGDDDLVLGGPAGVPWRLVLNDDGALREAGPSGLPPDEDSEDLGALLLDVDGDGDRDLYLASGGVEGRPGARVYADRLYLNGGPAAAPDAGVAWSRAPADALPDADDPTSAVAAADVDGDGDLDLFTGGGSVPGAWPAGAPSRLLLNDGGRFIDATAERAPGLLAHGRVTAALFLDVDDDGDPDLLVAHDWGPVRLWRNDGGALTDDTEAAGLAGLTGWWRGLAAADVDHDGDLDVAATNLGLGSRTRASVDEPAVLLHGDLDGSGTATILEATWVDGTLRPVRTRADVTAVMPILAEFFPTHSSWGEATVEDLFGAEAVAAAGRVEATTCESGVLLNDGAGRFTFRPFPRRAQVAPGRGLAFLELDGDGHPDLLLAQNDFTPQSEHGRLDGGVGQVLLGDGAGGFTPVRPDTTGFLVPADARALAVFDRTGDGTPFVAVSVNDGNVRYFEHRNDGGDRLAVRLVGPPGNVDATGARVTYTKDGAPTQTLELAAGSGALSQSGSTVWFGRGAGGDGTVRVRWPDGSVTEQAVDAETRQVVLSIPPR